MLGPFAVNAAEGLGAVCGEWAWGGLGPFALNVPGGPETVCRLRRLGGRGGLGTLEGWPLGWPLGLGGGPVGCPPGLASNKFDKIYKHQTEPNVPSEKAVFHTLKKSPWKLK